MSDRHWIPIVHGVKQPARHFAVLGAALYARKLALRGVMRRLLTARVPERVSRIPVYAMGSLAAFWCFERAAALWL